MKIFYLIPNLWILKLSMIFALSKSYTSSEFATLSENTIMAFPARVVSVPYKYERVGEVRKECGTVSSSASTFKLDQTWKTLNAVETDLFFVNGDWVQKSRKYPLMPFEDRFLPNKSGDPVQYVSFSVMGAEESKLSQNLINIHGVLELGIRNMGYIPYNIPDNYQEPTFQISPGNSRLTMTFEGVYFESQENGGERVMCMLGNSTLPSRDNDSLDSWKWVKKSAYNNYQHYLLKDDRILIVFRYPDNFTLTRRAINGSIKSLNDKSSPKYFDEIFISSQLGPNSKYQFVSGELVSKACNPYPVRDDTNDTEIEMYKEMDFCDLLKSFTYRAPFIVNPNLMCSGNKDYCNRLGPFEFNEEINATNGNFKDLRIIFQDVRCESIYEKNDESSFSANVSLVVRAVLPLEDQYISFQRSGLSGLTVVAEGVWKSVSGQLCMIGCNQRKDRVKDGCDSRICLYIPRTFSIKQRSVIFGSISHITKDSNPYFPISFKRDLQSLGWIWSQFYISHLSYKYSKINLATEYLMEKEYPNHLRNMIKKSLLSYPTLIDGDEVSLFRLSKDLNIFVGLDPSLNFRSKINFVRLDILSLNSMFVRYWEYQNGSTPEQNIHPSKSKNESLEHNLLNISAQLELLGDPNNNVSLLYLEGVYDPKIGKMYLIGCRNTQTSYPTLNKSKDIENGLDCLIRVKIEYPPTTVRWIMNPKVKISITSQRNHDDGLQFDSITLSTNPILYQRQREELISRKRVEGVLRILTLTLLIGCILGQIFYIKDNLDSLPYMSLVMLGIQALGFSFPLITGAEALFKKMASEKETTPYDLEVTQRFQVIDYIVKVLVLVALLLTLRLFQKVRKSRIRLSTRSSQNPRQIPSDKYVLILSLVIHTVGFAIVFIVHYVNLSRSPVQTQMYMDPGRNTWKWQTKLEEYIGLVQDLFLLPQIVGNILWQIDCKPLKEVYFFGVTIVRLLPHVYDYFCTPSHNPYFSYEYEFVNPNLDFYSKFGDMTILAVAILLAIIVYMQQRWGYQKLSHKLKLGTWRLLPSGSRAYQRLSPSFETELSSGVNEIARDNLRPDEVK